jgi:hypothetical protein
MGYIVTIFEGTEERQFEITDAAEIVPLFDIEPEAAAFELGFEPSHALLYYLVFRASPFNLELLDEEQRLVYMVRCIDHVWPLVEKFMPDEAEQAEELLELALLVADDAESALEYVGYNANLLYRYLRLKATLEPSPFRGVEIAPAREQVVRLALAKALKLLTKRTEFLLRIELEKRERALQHLPVTRPLVRSIRRQADQHAYEVALDCADAVEAAEGEAMAGVETEWQILEIFRLALGDEPKRSFESVLFYEGQSPPLVRHKLRVVGMIEPD